MKQNWFTAFMLITITIVALISGMYIGTKIAINSYDTAHIDINKLKQNIETIQNTNKLYQLAIDNLDTRLIKLEMQSIDIEALLPPLQEK